MGRAVDGATPRVGLASETEAGWDGFAALYERSLDEVWRCVFDACGWSGPDTETVVSQVFVQAASEHRLGDPAEIDLEWLLAQARRLAGEHRRPLRRTATSSASGIKPADDFSGELLAVLEREWYFVGVDAV